MTVKTTLADPTSPVAVVHTRPGCGPCGASIRLLQKLGISFEERNLMEHLADADRLRRDGYLQAPIIEPSSASIKPWSGFRPDRIASLALTSRTH